MISSVEEFVAEVRAESSQWPEEQPRWFRGEPGNADKPLLPSLYRYAHGSSRENQLLQIFRDRASAFATEALPDRKKTDQWLFLAQHVRLPTRLLDWSESALLALYFAVKCNPPVVWMLNPLHLNYHALGGPPNIDPNALREFWLPWHKPLCDINPAHENIRGAWENDRPGVDLPVAVHPSYVHSRLRAQRGCFTVHGKRKESLNTLVPPSILRRFVIDPQHALDIRKNLAVLGITESVAYPDLDGLSRDLCDRLLDRASKAGSERGA